MSKPHEPSDAPLLELRRLPLAVLIPTPENPRRHKDDGDFAELVKSIKQDGVLVPLIARPMLKNTRHVDEDGHYTGPCKKLIGDQPLDQVFDLRAGHRRLAAAKKAGLTELPVIVRDDMDDLTALRITIKENLDRENLTPFEEATGIQSYMDRGLTADQIGAEFGRTAQWVARRANLLSLNETWRNALATPDHWTTTWPVASLEAVAALASEQQDKIFKVADNPSYCYRELRIGTPAVVIRHITNEITHALKNAPWPLDDAVLDPKAGSCQACTNRSGANPLLWDGLLEQDVKSDDHCLNPQCWNAKIKAHTQRDLAALKEKHPDLTVVTGYSTERPLTSAVKKVGLPTISQYSATECKKSDPGAVPAVKLTDTGVAKKVVYVQPPKPREELREEGEPASNKPKTLKERRKELQERREEWAIQKWSDYVGNHFDELTDAATLPSDDDLFLLTHVFTDNTDPPGSPLKTWKRRDLVAARHYVFMNVLLGAANLHYRTGEDVLPLLEIMDGFLLNTAAPTILKLLGQAVTEIPEPAGWTADKKAAAGAEPASEPADPLGPDPLEDESANTCNICGNRITDCDCEHKPDETPSPKAKRASRRPKKPSRSKPHRPKSRAARKPKSTTRK